VKSGHITSVVGVLFHLIHNEMNLLHMNILGIGNTGTQIALDNLCFSHKFVFLFIAEPKIPFDQVRTWYCNTLNMHQFCLNITEDQLPNFWVKWKYSWCLVIIFNSNQCNASELEP
jgi:hypothetical protein